MADLTNISRPPIRNIGGGGNIKNELILVKSGDYVAPLPPVNENTGTITDNIQMLPGKLMHSIYVTERTLKPAFSRQEGSNLDCYGYQVSVEGFHPGLEAAILNFLRLHGDFRGLLIFRSIKADGTEVRYLIGESYNPVSISAAEFSWGAQANEDKGTKITIGGLQNDPIKIYEGTLFLQEDVKVPADATTIAYAGEGKYILTPGASASATIANITGMTHGQVIFIEGAGGEYPAKIAADEVFILKDSADFEGTSGAWITLKAFAAGAGKMQFIEQARG